jgi:uncharacterized membrane protein YfcA
MLAATLGLGVLIGLAIGGLGGGGGVLTVPLLVYLLGQSAQEATTSSVVIVGVTALAGVLARVRGGRIDGRTGLAFAAVGIPAAHLGTLLNQRVDDAVLLLSFAGLTLVAAAAMLLGGHPADDVADASAPAAGSTLVAAPPSARRRLWTAAKVAGCGLAVGFLTGFLGVGGGFLLIPALVVALRMPMALAVGTSLLVIALNAAAAVVARVGVAEIDWSVVAPFTAAAIVGTLLGTRVADRLPGRTLTRAFAALLVVVGAVVAVESVLAL